MKKYQGHDACQRQNEFHFFKLSSDFEKWGFDRKPPDKVSVWVDFGNFKLGDAKKICFCNL